MAFFFENVFKGGQRRNKTGGGFKHVLFSPLLGEDFQFDDHIFQMG